MASSLAPDERPSGVIAAQHVRGQMILEQIAPQPGDRATHGRNEIQRIRTMRIAHDSALDRPDLSRDGVDTGKDLERFGGDVSYIPP